MPAHENTGIEQIGELERIVSELRAALAQIWDHCQRLDAGLRTLAGHVDAVAAHSDGLVEHLEQAITRSWDEVAVTRRLAALEDQVIALLEPRAHGGQAT